MPDFGIGEAIAALSAFGGEALAGAGEAAGAIGGGLGELGGEALGGLGALGGGIESAIGGAGSAVGDVLGLGAGAEGAGAGAAGGLTSLEGGLTAAPTAAAGGVAPAGAGAIDLASAAGAGGSQALGFAPDFAATQEAIASGVFDPVGANFTTFGAGAGQAAAGGGGLSTLEAGVTGVPDLTSLAGGAGGGAGAAGGDIASLAGGAGKAVGDVAGGGGFLSNLGTSALTSLTKNPLGIAAAGVGLGYNMLQGSKTSQNEQNVQNIANTMAGQGQQLQSYLQTGTLPAGMQAQVDNAKAAAKAQIVSGYASKGMSADPSQNSALAQELAAVDTNALELQGKIATNLLQAGLNESNMSANLFQALIQMDATQAKQMGSAIANFATALAGGPKAIVLGGGATG